MLLSAGRDLPVRAGIYVKSRLVSRVGKFQITLSVNGYLENAEPHTWHCRIHGISRHNNNLKERIFCDGLRSTSLFSRSLLKLPRLLMRPQSFPCPSISFVLVSARSNFSLSISYYVFLRLHIRLPQLFPLHSILRSCTRIRNSRADRVPFPNPVSNPVSNPYRAMPHTCFVLNTNVSLPGLVNAI